MDTTTIYLIADCYALPDKIEVVRQILESLIEVSRKEVGCIRYELFENLQDKTHFTIIHRWQSEDIVENHFTAKHTLKATEMLKDILAKPTDVRRYTCLAKDDRTINKTKSYSGFCCTL
ncbi:unnamed protein product [Didymodactylos carnosus]|uniref:ABM domain-containing protein n=1 Tax=Didymodactylos carnosus TaxID=1234261 RepID=A0A815DAB1_9BILA|nr:unnamed protein product [Didymodactylos carnosus]CAF1462852.1 unnamed protein product [Didymodactylos carnosus]CAF4104169.1 unnamed protein product [Didymodactylos carnosus]CAF4255802.1 unnamed protein product [Didymodactylos carnosus]